MNTSNRATDAGTSSAPLDVVSYQLRLRELMSDLLLVEEAERRRLASDLHDGLSQTVALARMKLAAFRATLAPEAAEALDEIMDLFEQTDSTARSIGRELFPRVLYEVGLDPAVQWLVGNISTRYGIDIQYHNNCREKCLDDRSRVIMFRGIRELLINTAKHAQASTVVLTLASDGTYLAAAVADDGIGMDPATISNHGSGLLNLRERLEILGGTMEVHSSRDGSTRPIPRGTLIRLNLPFTSTQSDPERQLS